MANNYVMNEIDSLLQLSKEYRNQLQIEPAIETAYLALSKSTENEYSQGKTQAYLNLAQSIINIGDYERSLRYLSFAENEAYSTKNPTTQFEISKTRGEIFSNMRLEQQSIREFQKCILLIKKYNDKLQRNLDLSISYENLAEVYTKISKPDSAFYYINKNKEVLESMDESYIYRNLVSLYSALGEWYINNGEFETGNSYLDKALLCAEKYQYPYLSRTFMYKGDMYAKREMQDSALFFYLKALHNLDKTKIKEEFIPAYYKLYAIHKDAGAIDSANFYRVKYNIIESELSQAREKSLRETLAFFLKEQKKEQQHHFRNSLKYIVISLLLFVSLNIIGWIIFRKKMAKKKILLETKLNNTIKAYEKKDKVSHILEKKINESFNEVITLAKNNDPSFLKRFQEVYPEHTQHLLDKHPNLTNSELIVCAYLYLNFSTKDIANFLCVEHRSVQTKKSRLRKKLNLPASTNIEKYLHLLSDRVL